MKTGTLIDFDDSIQIIVEGKRFVALYNVTNEQGIDKRGSCVVGCLPVISGDVGTDDDALVCPVGVPFDNDVVVVLEEVCPLGVGNMLKAREVRHLDR